MKISYCIMGLTAAVAVWAGPSPRAGYLARLGPAPLRFEAPPKPLSEMAALPPLAMKDSEPAPAEVLGPPMPASLPEPVETHVSTPPPMIGPLMPFEPALTPQMFIQFFNDTAGTNREVNVVVPYQFTPPPATTIPAQPSRALYSVK